MIAIFFQNSNATMLLIDLHASFSMVLYFKYLSILKQMENLSIYLEIHLIKTQNILLLIFIYKSSNFNLIII